MADFLLDNQQGSTTGAITSGQSAMGIDSVAKIFYVKDDSNRFSARSCNAAIASQGAGFASDTWLTNSDILIPSWGFQAKTWFRYQIALSKTAAGVATPIINVRIGSARSTADTARLTLTMPAQTAIADAAILNLLLSVRSVGASGVIQGTAWFSHRGTVASSTIGTGFANDGTGHTDGTSAGFDNSALSGLYQSLSLNGGASASWTVTQVICEACW